MEARTAAGREIPSDPADLDSLVTATDWPNDSIAVNDWVVLESVGGNVSASFQLYLEYNSTTQMSVMMIPKADFTATGVGSASPPTFPSTAYGTNAGSLVNVGGFTSNATYSCVADEGMMSVLFDDSSSPDWTYAGEVESVFNSGTVQDARPFVIMDSPTTVGWGSFIFTRLSPFDEETVNTSGIPAPMMANNQNTHESTNVTTDSLGGFTSILPVGVQFTDAGHTHFTGFLRNVFTGAELLANNGARTISGSNYMYRHSNSTRPGVVWQWDGTTAYGGDVDGLLLEPPELTEARASGTMAFFSFSRLPVLLTTSSVTTVTISELETGSFDLNRLKVTYPFVRQKKKPGILSGND